MSNYFNNHKFSSNIKIPKLFKIGIGIVNVISKRLTLKIIVQIFSTPQKFKIPTRELGMLESAQKKMIYCSAIEKILKFYPTDFLIKKYF